MNSTFKDYIEQLWQVKCSRCLRTGELENHIMSYIEDVAELFQSQGWVMGVSKPGLICPSCATIRRWDRPEQ